MSVDPTMWAWGGFIAFIIFMLAAVADERSSMCRSVRPTLAMAVSFTPGGTNR